MKTNSKPTNAISNSKQKIWYTRLVNTIGYGLLFLVFADLISMMIPSHLMNPSWEFQKFGELVEKIAIPLVAVAFIFFGEEQTRTKFELSLLKGVTWICLLVGVVLLFLIPVTFSNIYRLNTQINVSSKSLYTQQLQQLNKVEQQLKKTNEAEINRLLKNQGRSIAGSEKNQKESNSYFTPETNKTQLLLKLYDAKRNLADAYETGRNEQRSNLFKSGIKWSIGALVAGFIFIYTWHLTKG